MVYGNNKYRDRLFTFIFGNEENREWTLSLYNAVNGSSYSDTSALEFTTIKEVLYLGMHNDVSFLIHDEMNLYEQQSTFNPNIPVRMLQYCGQLFERFIVSRKKNKFGRTLIGLPEPRLVVFYNGTGELPDMQVLEISDAFDKFKGERLYFAYPDTPSQDVKEHDYDISVRVQMININHGRNKPLMEACKPLFEYAWIVQAVRDNLNQSDKQDKEALVEAIAKMIHDIPDDFILKPFLVSHHAEIVSMLLTEYDEVEAMNLFRLEGKLEGLKEGKLEGLKEGKLEGLKEGKLEGLKDGKRELNSIYCKLIQEGRMDELQNAISDPGYLEELAKEFTHAESPNKSGES